MVLVLSNGLQETEIKALVSRFEDEGFRTNLSYGAEAAILGLIGDTSRLNEDTLRALPCIENVIRVSAPYKLASRTFHPENTIVDVNGVRVGDSRHFTVMAGPCSVESEEQIISVAKDVKRAGAQVLRGGAFKPRTSPYSFQGMGQAGLELLKAARKATGLPVITELMSSNQLELFEDIDIIQIGARNMQNFDLLKEAGGFGKPILLKRGLSSTIKELLMSVEYLMAAGNANVIICERGIRTFDSYTRNCLDLSAVPYLQKETHLPVVVDPSHACGIAWMVPRLAKAAAAAGADGILVEVHNNPACALCDGEQSLTPAVFAGLMRDLAAYAALEGRTLGERCLH
ncbi:MAG: 3-deoxy-7-phosphoheptulonate synthase [Spirochaetaceae bacterium]|jgi:3-deoxy-7-phosphoheptulonate synthase|nr:3-deoxy-7-phosphoheptulonate synthase [Spirochaetaceae bacterium]